jgi:hypothetical protein
MTVLPCIVCKKELEALDSGSPNHATDANSFQSMGQYGSTVFDPMDGTFLEVNICDACLVDAAKHNRVMHGHHRDNLKLWDGK